MNCTFYRYLSKKLLINFMREHLLKYELVVNSDLLSIMHFQDFYHSSEITSIKVSNNTKRNFALGNDNVNREANENMKIKLLVELSDEGGSDGPAEEERIRSMNLAAYWESFS